MDPYRQKKSAPLEAMSQVAVFLLSVSLLVCFAEIQTDLRSCWDCTLALRRGLRCSTHCS